MLSSVAIFTYDDSGHVDDSERDSIDADALMMSLKAGNGRSNEERKQRGWQIVQLEGWHRRPFYDQATSNLTWATEVSSDIHPLAGAGVLCAEAEFLRVARLWYFDNLTEQPLVERIVADTGLNGRLLSGPETWDDGLSQFCPRCHATYLDAATACHDCQGITLEQLRRSPASVVARFTVQR